MTKQELAIKTLNLAEQLRVECDIDGEGRYNGAEWVPCNETVTRIILEQFGYNDNLRVEQMQGGLKFRIVAEYEQNYCAVFYTKIDYKANWEEYMQEHAKKRNTITAALAEFTLPAFLEKCYPGGIRAALELIAQFSDYSTKLTSLAAESKVDNSAFDSPSVNVTYYRERDTEYTIEWAFIDHINANGGNITFRALGAIMGFPWDEDDEEHINFWYHVIKYSYGKLGLLLSVWQGTTVNIELDDFFNSPYDILPPQLYLDTYRVPTFKGILKGVEWGSEFGGNAW